jgi:hypothetical protein
VKALALLAAATITAPAPVTALSANGGALAYATAWTKRACERVWFHGKAFPTGQCPAVSTGRGVAGVAVAGSRVVWLAYAGGNIREWSLLTATTTRPQPRLLRFVARDVDLPSPIVLGSSGGVVPYAVGRSVVALNPKGSRAFAWTAPADVRALASSGPSVAVVVDGGKAYVVRGGAIVRTVAFDGEADAVALAGSTLVLQRGRILDLRVSSTSRTWTLPASARLQDASATEALYVAGGKVHALRFADGSDSVVAGGTLAQLDAGRTVVASGSRISK